MTNISMTLDALKPCPFCGGDAEIFYPAIIRGDDDADVDWMRPFCKKCGVVGRKVRFRDHWRKSPDHISARAEAIAAWNTRSGQLVPVPSVEKVARTIYADHFDQHGYPNGLPTWEELPEHWLHKPGGFGRDYYRSLATAVIAALKGEAGHG